MAVSVQPTFSDHKKFNQRPIGTLFEAGPTFQVPVRIKGAKGQTGNLLELYEHDDVVLDGNALVTMSAAGAFSAGIINNVRVVDGNKFPTIQAAIDDLPAVGGKVFLPIAETVTTAVAVNKPVHFIGHDRGTTITRGANIDVFSVTSNGVTFEDFVIDGNKSNFATQNDLINIGSADEGLVHHVTFKNSSRTAMFAATASDWRIRENIFSNNDGWVIFFEKNSHRNIVQANYFDATNHTGPLTNRHLVAFHSTTAGQTVDDNQVINNIMRKAGTSGFAVEIGSFSGDTPTRALVSGNIILMSSSPSGGVSFSGITDSKIEGNIIEGPAGIAHIEIVQTQDSIINGNRSKDSGDDGININRSSNNIIANNIVSGATDNGIILASPSAGSCNNNHITGNTIRGSGIQGIMLTSDAVDRLINENRIVGNYIADSQDMGVFLNIIVASSGVINDTVIASNQIIGNNVANTAGNGGIRVRATANDTIIQSNRFRNNNQGDIFDAGTGTIIDEPISAGIFSNGTGFKHTRLTTGSIGASSSAAVTHTWTTAFADANYTVAISVVEADTDVLTLHVDHIESISASQVVIRVENRDAGAARTGTLHLTATHD